MSIRLANGLSVDFLDPVKQQRITYANKARRFSIDLEYTAFIDAAMCSNKHFKQVTTLTLSSENPASSDV